MINKFNFIIDCFKSLINLSVFNIACFYDILKLYLNLVNIIKL
jgi:hypothetical protein